MAQERDGEREPAAERPSRGRERERAGAYLDLWERHLGLTAVDGPWPPPRRED
jgi:hypothetical protein